MPANPLNGIDVIPKITVGGTPTAFTHMQSAVLTTEGRDIEYVSPASTWVGRDREFTGWSMTMRVLVPSTADSAINQMETHVTAATKGTVHMTEPSLKSWNGSALITITATGEVGSKYTKEFTCAGHSTLATA